MLHWLKLGVLGMAMGSAPVTAEVAAVVSPQLSVATITENQLADIYLGRSSRLPDGTPVMPCDLPEGSPLREEFYAKIIGRSAAQMKAHWSKMIFTGRGEPPMQVPNSAAAKKLVAENPGMICYIDSRLVDRSVKALIVR